MRRNLGCLTMRSRSLFVFLSVLLFSTPSLSAGVLDADGRLVQFERDIAPILREKCLECHGPEDAKNDFRVDEVDGMMSYVEAEDVEASSLFTDYLTAEDEDMLMPPTSHGGPLSPGELALLRTWIHEGAIWPEGFQLVVPLADNELGGSPIQVIDAATTSEGLLARVWAFQGYLHPAAVHFPIALLLVGGLFVVLGWKWPSVGTQVPLTCLWLGAPAAVATTLMGWSFATEQGYGAWTVVDTTKEVFWHRWSAVFITLLAVISAIVAGMAVRRESPRLTATWKAGLLVAAMLVGLVGHQGGELTYGETFYQRAFDRLWPPVKNVLDETVADSAIHSQVDREIAGVTFDRSMR